LITCTERHEHGDRGVSLETTQPQAKDYNARQFQSGGDDTYGKCVKYRPSAPMPSSLPSSSTPTRRAAEPIRYGNFYTPLCMESSPLESYVCPLFDAQCQSGHSSQPLEFLVQNLPHNRTGRVLLLRVNPYGSNNSLLN
jgi:hypothetical protein